MANISVIDNICHGSVAISQSQIVLDLIYITFSFNKKFYRFIFSPPSKNPHIIPFLNPKISRADTFPITRILSEAGFK